MGVNLKGFCKENYISQFKLFIIPGAETNIASLNKYLKIIDIEAKELENGLTNDKNWKFLDSWSDLNALNENNDYLNDFESYPLQHPAFSLINKPDDKFEGKSYAMYIDNQFNNSLLVLGEKQQIRYAIWNSINLASLKYILSGTKINFLFENSMNNITNWLMKKK